MQDFAAELRAAREGPPNYDAVEVGSTGPTGGFGAYLVQSATRSGYLLGYEAGQDEIRQTLPELRERHRLAGFDAGVRVLLQQTLRGLADVAGELESRRAHKVMIERSKARLMELIEQLGSVHDVLPPAEPTMAMDMGIAKGEPWSVR
jgi:hypothetical protein